MQVFKEGSALSVKAPATLSDNVSVSMSKRTSEAQRKFGIVGKGRIIHPAFSADLTFHETRSKDRIFVREQEEMTPATTAGGKPSYRSFILFNDGIKEAILARFNDPQPTTPWYLKMLGKAGAVITTEIANPDLGILDVEITRQTQKMVDSGFIAAVAVVTDIAKLTDITISYSAYDESLRLQEPKVSRDPNERDTCYRLSSEAKAQILCMFHEMVDWDEIRKAQPTMQSKIEERKAKREADALEAKAAMEAATAATSDLPDATGDDLPDETMTPLATNEDDEPI